MSQDSGTHPNLERLAAFDAGRLTPVEQAEIERHVAGCESCCRQLETLPDDAFVALVRAFSQPGEPSLPPALVGHPRYRILGPLGQGGMGTVWKAVQLLLDRVVALKVVHPHLLDRPGFAERFHREARALASLNHPNVAQAHDAEQTGPTHFLVMEYVEGESLDRLVAERGRLPQDEAIALVRQAALGLAHAHERGILHRDLKPQNLIRARDGTVKIVDFGLARLVWETASSADSADAVVGTPDFVAPEQARQPGKVDARADLYGLGGVLYYLLSGQVPFPGGTALQKLMRHQEETPRPLSDLRPEVSEPLSRLTSRLLERDPARRPASAADVVREIDASTRVPSPMVRRGRRRFLLALGGAAALGAGAAVWFALPQRRRPDPERPNEEPPQPSQPDPELLDEPLIEETSELASPELVTAWKKDLRDRSLAWLKEYTRFGPDADLVVRTGEDLARSLDKGDGAQVIFGGGLMKSGRAALLAVRVGGVFPFDLSAEQTAALRLKPNARRVESYYQGHEGRRVHPRVVLSGLQIDQAEALPRDRRISGRVSYAGLGPVERPHVRMTCYPFPLKKRVTGYWYLRERKAAATVAFDFGALGDDRVQQGPIVLFIELACWEKGLQVIESNTLAVLVTPKDAGR